MTSLAFPGQGRGLEVLVFEVDGQRCAIPTGSVVELVHAVSITPLPGAPRLVEGVVNLRGRIVPVVDMRARLGRPARALEAADHFIVASAGGRVIVLRVDRALDLAFVEEVPPRAADAPDAYLDGVTEIAGGLVLIRDVATFLSAVEGRSLDAALSAEAGT